MVLKAVIPAAGKGTRMNPVTKSLPKEMLPLGGKLNFKPFIHYVVEESIESGVCDILIITRPGKQAIQHYFDVVGIEGVHYKNQREQKGLGDAVLQAEAFVDGKPFAVLLGDDYIDCKEHATKQLVKEYNKLPNESTLIGVERLPNKAMTKKGMVITKNSGAVMQVTDLIEKPSLEEVTSNLAIIGRYILPTQIFDILKKVKPGYGGEIQLTDAIKILLSKGHPVYAYEIKGTRIDMGTPTTYVDSLIYKLRTDPKSKQETLDILKKHLDAEDGSN